MHSMEKVPWKPFDEVPQQNICNMDELTADSSGHFQKIIGQCSSLRQVFQITPEGYDRMPFCITIYLLSCATGIYSFPSCKTEGAPPPLINHSNNWTVNVGKKDNVAPAKKTLSKNSTKTQCIVKVLEKILKRTEENMWVIHIELYARQQILAQWHKKPW